MAVSGRTLIYSLGNGVQGLGKFVRRGPDLVLLQLGVQPLFLSKGRTQNALIDLGI